MAMNMAGRRAGFTLVEVVVSVALLGLIVTGVLKTLEVTKSVMRDQNFRYPAAQLAQNELERLRAAGPAAAAALPDTLVLNRAGEVDPAGPYTVVLESALVCSGGPSLADNVFESIEIDGDCSSNGQRPVLAYTVHVRFQVTDSVTLEGKGAAYTQTIYVPTRRPHGGLNVLP